MSDRPATSARSSGAIMAVVVVALFLSLPALYVLSIGPAAWLVERNVINGESPIFVIYYPLGVLAESWEPVATALDWYMSFWQ